MFGFSSKPAYIIAGLGNPGSDYQRTRHNVGFLVLDTLADKHGVSLTRMKYHSLMARTTIDGKGVLLMKPQTYMNNSGEAIEEAASYFKIPPEHIIVISDDINLEPGKLRIRRSGSAGGHNGLKSIIECTGSDQFPRVRVGIGDRNRRQEDLADFVLSKFTEDDLKALPLEEAAEAAELILAGNIAEAMNRFN